MSDELEAERLAASDAIAAIQHDYFIHPQHGGYFGALDPRIERPRAASDAKADPTVVQQIRDEYTRVKSESEVI